MITFLWLVIALILGLAFGIQGGVNLAAMFLLGTVIGFLWGGTTQPADANTQE